MDIFLQDLRYAARKLLRTPGFTIVAVATLALAIGATTAVFSIVDGVILKPLPFRAPERLVRLESTGRDGKPFPLSPADYLDYTSQTISFSGLAQFGVGSTNFSINGAGEPSRLDRANVGPAFFGVLGVSPVLGRFFASTEGAPGTPNVVVISDKLWRTRFAGDRAVLGKSITLDERPFTIIGVASSAVNYPQPADVWTPRAIVSSTDPSARGAHQFYAIARMKDGVTLARAKEDVATLARRLGEQYPDFDQEFGGNVTLLQEQMVGNLRTTLFAILGAVGFVLLIGCANVANLLLVRAASRSGEMAVRTALGAPSGRILRQLLTESLLLSAAGAAIGISAAAWVVKAIVALGPRVLPRLQDVSVNGRVLAVSVIVSILTGIIFGLAPALHAARPNIAGMLRESVRGSGRGVDRLRSGLVVAEMALAVVLLIGAGLLIKSFTALLHVNPGFRTENVVTFDLSLPPAKYARDGARLAAITNVVDRLRALPGTETVGVTVGRPLARMMMMTMFDVVGEPPKDPMNRTITEVHAASPSFFTAMGMTLKRGRLFTDAENRRDGHQVLVVNEELARRYFPSQNPIGKEITLGMGYNEPAFAGDTSALHGEIVGIIGDVKQRGLSAELFPSVYVPYNVLPGGSNSIVVRTRASRVAIETAIRSHVREVDPRLPVIGLSTMEQVVSDSVAQPRFYMTMLAAFAGIALVLAAIGIYGVISFTVAQRSRELGIRIALGASTGRVLRQVLGEGLTLTGSGVVIGLIAAFGLTRLISSMLFGVAAVDAVTFGGVAATLIAIALLASWLPARRAAAVDPVIAMRAE